MTIIAHSKVRSQAKQLRNIQEYINAIMNNIGIVQLVSTQAKRQTVKPTKSSTWHTNNLILIAIAVNQFVRHITYSQTAHVQRK